MEREFVSSSVQGVAIAGVCATLVLLFYTQNIIQTFFSMISIAMVVISIMSVIVLQEWELGVSESVSLVIIVGFSVDYVVHLSGHYVHSPFKTR